MHITILANPIAGRGHAGRLAKHLAARLRDDGHDADVASTPAPGVPVETLNGRLGDAIVVLGGDGAVRSVVPLATARDVPVYPVPLGTANLFAREVGASRSYDRLRETLEHGAVRRVDVGDANGIPFTVMCSVGFDADVVHRLDGARNGSISHASYLPHIVRELASHRFPRLRITVDGEPLAPPTQGIVIVANAPAYAMHLDPVRDAVFDDGRLDVLLMPCRSAWGLLRWAGRLARRSRRGAITARGGEILVDTEGEPRAFQVDGDPSPDTGAGRTPIRITVRPGVLPVFVR